eukprot:2779866-Rhodomonas_salina.6
MIIGWKGRQLMMQRGIDHVDEKRAGTSGHGDKGGHSRGWSRAGGNGGCCSSGRCSASVRSAGCMSGNILVPASTS